MPATTLFLPAERAKAIAGQSIVFGNMLRAHLRIHKAPVIEDSHVWPRLAQGTVSFSYLPDGSIFIEATWL